MKKYKYYESNTEVSRIVADDYNNLDPKFQFVKAMRESREENQFSQVELQTITGIDRANLSRIENGTGNPSIETMIRIANGLGKQLQIRMV